MTPKNYHYNTSMKQIIKTLADIESSKRNKYATGIIVTSVSLVVLLLSFLGE